MGIEFKNGIRVTPHQHELSPLEAAIERYAAQAKAYYLKEQSLPKSLNKQEREAKLSKALEHLETERRFAETIVSVQSRLEDYRAAGVKNKSGSSSSVLYAEKHHPTKTLARFMRTTGRPQPSKAHTPHHIVAGKGKTLNAARARILLHARGVRINDPDNGVWLVRLKKDTPHWSMPKSTSHLCLHTHKYESWVFSSLRSMLSEQAIRSRLKLLGCQLQEGKQPPKICSPAQRDEL